MWIPFQNLPDTSRVWVFQAEKPIPQSEIERLYPEVKQFIEEWTSHQATVRASFEFQYDYFLIVAVDEAQVGASGCSIDKMFRFVQSMESNLGVSLLGKQRIALLKNNSIRTFSLPELKSKIKSGEIQTDETYFDLLVTDKSSLSKDWIKPLSSGWLAKHSLN